MVSSAAKKPKNPESIAISRSRTSPSRMRAWKSLNSITISGCFSAILCFTPAIAIAGDGDCRGKAQDRRKAPGNRDGVQRLPGAHPRRTGAGAADGDALGILRLVGGAADDGGVVRRDLLYRGTAPKRDRNSDGAR